MQNEEFEGANSSARPSVRPSAAFSHFSMVIQAQSVGRAKKYHLASHFALLAFDVNGAGREPKKPPKSPPNLTI